MDIKVLLNEINLAPTLMNISDELRFIDNLMVMPLEELSGNKECFISILERLDESHSLSGYFEVTKNNKDKFLKFSKWLEDIGRSQYFSNLNEDLSSYATTFKLLPWEIYGENNL